MDGGNKQIYYISKEYSISPTVATASVLLSFIIYAKEEGCVSVINITNDFIQTRIENKNYMAIINICKTLVDMLLDIALYVYVLYVTTERKGIKQLITLCMNSIYGTILASLLYYCKIFKTMKLNTYKMNPYDPCVSNRPVNALQQSILFHVDDFKLSQKYPKVNDSFIGIICEKYQIIVEDGSGTMQVIRGKLHKYLGMKLDYFTVGQVNITMLDYIYEILDTFDKADPTGGSTKSSAAPAIIVKVDEYCKKIIPNKLWSLITLWKEYYFLPSRPGRTPAL